MNRIRAAIIQKMRDDGLDFNPDTVHVVALDFGSGIFAETPNDFTDVLLTVDLTHRNHAGAQVHSVVRIPVEGWSVPWQEIQRGILDAVNNAGTADMPRPQTPTLTGGITRV